MIIRKANISDLKQIINIFIKENSKKPYYEKWSTKSALIKINNYFKNDKINVIIVENKLAGFIIYNEVLTSKGKNLWVHELFIDSNFQNKGLGTALMNNLAKTYSKKISSINLLANRNASAYNFYKKLKYKELDESAFMYKKL
jgi:ribosomal protein S18 acetylase RimI-like enzyme